MLESLHEELKIPRLAYRLYVNPYYRAAKLVAPPTLAALLIALEVGTIVAIGLGIIGLLLIVWLPSLLGRVAPADMVVPSVDGERLTLQLEQRRSFRLADVQAIETILPFWPGRKNRIILRTAQGVEEVRTTVDSLPLFKLLNRINQRLPHSAAARGDSSR